MNRTLSGVAAMGLVVLLALPAQAFIIDTYPDWDNNVTNGWRGTAQTITGPLDNLLLNYRFALAPRLSPGSIDFRIFEWGAFGPVGPALFSQTIAWDGGGDVNVTGINLALNTGTLYGMAVDLQGYAGQSVHFNANQNSYTGGNGWWTLDVNGNWVNFTGFNHKFRAEFASSAPTPEPTSVLLLLTAGVGGALSRLRRRTH